MAERKGMCEWGQCTNEDTDIVLSATDDTGNKVRKRFCCFEHLAAWAVKRAAKPKMGRFDVCLRDT